MELHQVEVRYLLPGERTVDHLVANAVRSTPPTSTVEIGAGDDDAIVVWVEDDRPMTSTVAA